MPAVNGNNEWKPLYNGSAAYQMEVELNAVPKEEPELQKQPEQTATEEPYTKNRSKVDLRPQGKISVTAVAGFAMAAMLAVGVLTSHIQLTSIYADTVSAQRQLSALEEESAKLETEYEAVFDTATLKAAAERADLQEPVEGQKVYMELSDPDNAVVYHTEGDETGLRGCIHAVKSFFTGIGAYFS